MVLEEKLMILLHSLRRVLQTPFYPIIRKLPLYFLAVQIVSLSVCGCSNKIHLTEVWSPTYSRMLLSWKNLPNFLWIKLWKLVAQPHLQCFKHSVCVFINQQKCKEKIWMLLILPAFTAVITSAAVFPDNDWGFWPPNHSHGAIRIIKITSTRLQKTVHPSPFCATERKIWKDKIFCQAATINQSWNEELAVGLTGSHTFKGWKAL